MKKLEFFYDIVSPYSYIAATQMAKFEGKAEVVWKPVLLGGVFKATGNSGPAFTVPAKMPYMFKDLQRLSAYYQIPLKMPANFPANTVTVQRVLCAASDAERPALTLKLYDAYWGQGLDVTNTELLTELVGAELLAKTQDEDIKNQLKTNTEAAVAYGAFGVPSFVMDNELYFGEDRLFLIHEALK
ncbi:MAG: 2-hydroxychromene-2-carboxylate isomerase [Moraxellaceae bacterium]|nr:2-hydroxychromene-2-carboxylate isomerase [Moraxellaceae bacterium]